MKTFSPKPADIDRQWFVVDAQDQILGRLATQIAHRLRGKHKPEFAPHMDNGDFIVVVNCEKIRVTGTKLQDKFYYRHSGYIGGLKEVQYKTLMATKPELAMTLAVKGMLPHNTLGAKAATRLKVYAGANHKHEAQKPVAVEV